MGGDPNPPTRLLRDRSTNACFHSVVQPKVKPCAPMVSLPASSANGTLATATTGSPSVTRFHVPDVGPVENVALSSTCCAVKLPAPASLTVRNEVTVVELVMLPRSVARAASARAGAIGGALNRSSSWRSSDVADVGRQPSAPTGSRIADTPMASSSVEAAPYLQVP